jgi:hypothetical protein
MFQSSQAKKRAVRLVRRVRSRAAVFASAVLSFGPYYRVVEALAGEQAVLEVDENV